MIGPFRPPERWVSGSHLVMLWMQAQCCQQQLAKVLELALAGVLLAMQRTGHPQPC
jgi:hypothetical protein